MQVDAVQAAQELAKVKSECKDKALQPDIFTQAKLVQKHVESHDTRCVISTYRSLLLNTPFAESTH